MFPYQDGKYFDSLYQVVQQCYPQLDKAGARDVLRELILAPKSDSITIGNAQYSRSEVIQTLQYPLNGENEEKPFDERYHDLMEAALKTIKHMNDGYITEEDYEERKNFLDKINKKEFQVFTLLALLKSCHSLDNPELTGQLIYKVRSLRELNDLIRKYTKDAVAVNTDVQDYERAKLIYKMLKSLQGLGYGYTISPKEKENLGISHDDDEDLSEDYSFDNWLRRLMLLQLRRETRATGAINSNNLSAMFESNIGKSSTFFDDIGGRISELRGALLNRRFDSSRFNMLE
ncbi:MAG: hypothetical protein SPC24_01685, partial [Alphaproteobacteria bacterium]|nr:hypothetical protein [Alphaproteobacteria bacterium]